jgi:hypothetical protein
MIHRPAEADLMAQMHRRLRARIAEQGPAPMPPSEYRPPVDPARSARSRRTCHGYSLYSRPRTAPPKDSGAYVPEMAARLENDGNLTDGARRCARKLAEYAYRKNREGRAAEITVTYLMRALGKCRRSVQRYLRLLEREGYIKVDVVHGGRSRMCVGLVVHLLGALFPRHHRKKWPQKSTRPDAPRESQNNKSRFKTQLISLEAWAWRCRDGVGRSHMKTLPPFPLSL